MSDWFFNFRREMGHRVRDWIDRWRALPKESQWKIAGSLLAVGAVSLAVTSYLVLKRPSPANDTIESNEVVLYTSVDVDVLRPILDEFEATTGIRVQAVTDTEATKTTGLVQRMLSERDKPRADVWWSNEALGTVTLAKAGILEPFVSREEAGIKGGWPSHVRPADKMWYGFAQRARVIAYNTNRYTKSTVPTKLRDLTKEAYRGRVGMARPQFGTTRTHIAALVALHGEEAAREWMTAMKDNGVRIYDGNSSVVQAIANNEIDIGLTDTDDVYAAKREGWPVEMVFEVPDRPGTRAKGLPSVGPLTIPNSVGRVRGCRHPNEALKLVDFILSPRTEEMLAQSHARNIPVRPDLAKKYDLSVPNPVDMDMGEIAKSLTTADRLINQVFPLQ
jgi:iron(III) transport system substrate-binding protein